MLDSERFAGAARCHYGADPDGGHDSPGCGRHVPLIGDLAPEGLRYTLVVGRIELVGLAEPQLDRTTQLDLQSGSTSPGENPSPMQLPPVGFQFHLLERVKEPLEL